MSGEGDDWDTSAPTELPQDPFNKSTFASPTPKAAALVEPMAGLEVAGEAEAEAAADAEAAPAPAPAPAAAPVPAAAPTPAVAPVEPAPAPVATAPAEVAAAPAGVPAPAAAEKPALPVEKFEEQAAATAEAEKEAATEAAMPAPVAVTAPAVAAAAAAAAAAPLSPAPLSAASPGSSKSPSSGSPGRRGSSVPLDAPEFLKDAGMHTGEAFTDKLSPEALAFFNELCLKPFHEQAVSFLNAYWNEVGSQAEFIFSVVWETMKYADMHSKGVNYYHQYDEGNELDFNIGLYFYEKLCKAVLDDADGAKWRDDPALAMSMPSMMTAIKRKIELREKVDVNFDGKVGMLEVLLYQYRDVADPVSFLKRAMATDAKEHPEITKARLALEEVNKAIRAYEAEKHRLTELSAKPGVKGLGAKHQLAILDASPMAEELNVSLIKAEAAVRKATRLFGVPGAAPPKDGAAAAAAATAAVATPTAGAIWWLNRDLEAKKALYGKRGGGAKKQ